MKYNKNIFFAVLSGIAVCAMCIVAFTSLGSSETQNDIAEGIEESEYYEDYDNDFYNEEEYINDDYYDGYYEEDDFVEAEYVEDDEYYQDEDYDAEYSQEPEYYEENE